MPLTGPLNGTVPSHLRGLAFFSLSDYGRVGSGTVISDGGGGGTTTWAEGGTVACRVDPLGGGVGRSTGGQIDERSTHQVTVPPGVVVSPSNRFTLIGGGTFEVTATHTRTAAELQVFEVIQIS